MKVSFNKAKVVFHRIGNTEVYTKEGTVANGQKYLNWTKKVQPGQEKEVFGFLEKVPGQDFFADIYSYIVRRTNRYSRDGHVTTELERIVRDGGSTFTVLEDGVKCFKFVYDVDGTHLKTIFYDSKGIKTREIEVK